MSDISIDALIDQLEQYSKYLSDEQIARLTRIFNIKIDTSTPLPAGSDVMDNLMTEVQAQMQYVQQLRQTVTSGGAGAATTRELKDMVQATSSLFTMLTKINETVTNQDRLRKIELATLEAIKTLPDDARLAYFSKLEELLNE